MKLPKFKYHPDPISTGAIERSDVTCQGCGEAHGYRYSSSIYSQQKVSDVCPWCIHDGSAHKRFNASFVDDYPLQKAGLSQEIIEEVSHRTPGYVSWQQESWMCCCDDACEFHGDASRTELLALNQDGLEQLSHDSGFLLEDLKEFIESYEPKGSPAFYKFVCRHCRRVMYNGDCD